MARSDKVAIFIDSFDDEQLALIQGCLSAVAPIVHVLAQAMVSILTDEQKGLIKEVIDDFG